MSDLGTIRKAIDKFVEQTKSKQVSNDRASFVNEISQEVVKIFQPLLQYMAESARMNKEDLRAVAEEIAARINIPEIRIPDLIMPEINVPEPKVTVNVPKIDVPKIPDIIMPDEMNVRGWVSLMGVDLNNPLPVQLRDAKGNPVKLFENLTTLVSGGGGGGFHNITVGNVTSSSLGWLTNADNRLRVSVETGGSGITDAEIRASALPVIQASGAINSINILQVLGNPAVVGSGYQDNALRIVMATDAVTSVNVVSGSTAGTEYVDEGTSPLPSGGLLFLRDSLTSTYAAVSGAGYADSRTIRVVHATDVGLSTNATQAGTWNIGTVTTVTGVTNSLAASVVDSSGVQYSGSNPIPITWVSGSGATVGANMIDSSGVAYTTSNPLPIGDAGGSLTIDGSVSVTGSITSTVVTGAVIADVADDGSAPVKIGGIARTANPTAVAGGDSVSSSYDDIGRIITRPVQVRDLLTTATATLTTGTETTLLASAASTYNDLIYIMGANNSDVAATVDIRSGTLNSVLMTLRVPANGTAGVALPVPLPQEVAQATWTADMEDITGTTVYISALFSKEV